MAAAELSKAVLGLPVRDVERIRNLFRRAGLPTEVRLSPAQRKLLLGAMRLDKKVSGGEIKFVLVERIGKSVWGRDVAPERIQEALDLVQPRASQASNRTPT